MEDQRAFSGIKVLDFTQGVAGPHSTMLLAQHGADVIKVDPPNGDWGRSMGALYGDHCAHSIAFNRGKRSIVLDMKQSAALEITKKMATECDVVVEAFRPGVMGEFGLSYDDVKKTNPNVIYLSVTGFGQEGPNNGLPVTDAIIQAYSGFMTINRDSQGLPNRVNMVPIDVATGLYAFQALSTALMRKFRYGTGCYVDNSLMQSAAAFQAAKIAEHYLESGEVKPLYAPVGTMKTADGYMNVTAMRDQHYETLCDLLGLPEFKTDPRFNHRDKRIQNEKELMIPIRAAFEQQSSAHWSKLLTEAGVMNAGVQDHGAFMNHAHTMAVGAVAYVEHDGTGTIPMPQIPGLPRIEGPSAATHAPHIGEHSIEILKEWGYSDYFISELLTKKVTAVHGSKAATAE
ncbi:MAG: CoA transferase [Proteobacteria bacterium]|nr:CoA transferase [Pseudomonadota bacterium]